tara:strand:- start:678 stop:1649 length:972 start_codon:yes stop_codon:yes gene_type:complete
MNTIRYIDLFAGIGGFHQAMNTVQSTCVFASEWDEKCKQTYSLNYEMTPHGDITEVNEEEIPPHDLICAGFPCQAFSISGKQLGFADTRGTLFFDVARIAKHHQPKAMILENVKNFARHDQGNTLRVVISTLNEIGYQVFHQVLNASHFGAPQKRERVFIVALRKDLNARNFVFPTSSGEPTKLEDMLLPDFATSNYVINREDVYLKDSVVISKDASGHYPQRPIRLGIVNKGGQGERIYSPLGHAITLSAYGGGVGAKTGLYLINNKIRRLAPRECARITGFPENFILNTNRNAAYKQFGNSVVVNVVQAIVQSMIETNCFS